MVGHALDLRQTSVHLIGTIHAGRTLSRRLFWTAVGLTFFVILADAAPPKGDLYAMPGLSVKSRAGIKKLVSALLFDPAPNRKRFLSKNRDSKLLFAPEDQMKGFDEVLRAIKAHHAGIAHLFGSGVGHELQFLESKIMAMYFYGLDGPVSPPCHYMIA